LEKYFDIYIEFNRSIVVDTILDTISKGEKGFVCVIDGNVLTTSFKNENYKTIINNGLVNICDGSSIAMIAGFIHKKKFSTFTGPEIFEMLIKNNCKQYLLGNTDANLKLIKNRFSSLGYRMENFIFKSLPFKSVNDFDYETIANEINEFAPSIIWISLGDPKQEIFITKLIPFLNKGVLFAIGAAFNLFLGDKSNKRAPIWMRKLHLEWVFRVLLEPNRVGKRALSYLASLPKLILFEINNRNETVN